MNPADEIVGGVPLFEFRAVTQSIYTLSHSLDPMGTEPSGNADPAYAYLCQSEHDVYRWMQSIAGQPGVILAAEIYRDIHLAYSEAEMPNFQTPDNPVAELCAKLELHSKLLNRLLVAHCQLNNSMAPPTPRKYRIGLSFAGQRRTVVEEVANLLTLRFAQSEILYDNWYKPILSQPNLDIILPPLYLTETDLSVVFICEHYAEKPWCGLEMRYIRQLIMNDEGNRLHFFRFDRTEVPGLLPLDGFTDVSKMTPFQIAKDILSRYDHEVISASR